MKMLKIKLPHNEEEEFESGKPIILLGANGAGKTRLSIKIEELNDPTFGNPGAQETILIHRISAQKSLSIQESISILDNESSKRSFFCGDSNQYATKLGSRFKSNPATFLLDDFNKALSLLFSEENRELQLAHQRDKQAIEKKVARPEPITTVVERATEIWNELLPHRKIDLTGNGVHVNYESQRYHGKEMSDGERVMLYMICQVLVQRPNTLLIIDEPELHIHKSIVDKLWTRLEYERTDCVFMYITHDINFALSRNDAKILWVKSYSGTDWEYEFLDINDYDDIPEALLYEIIGTRQKVLFVEGTKNSYDYYLYQEIYKDEGYHVIPCGGCQEVIRLVKAKRGYEKLKAINVYGIIDRDFRTEHEMSALQNDGIYCLDVAEVENLFVVPELLDVMETALACNPGAAQNAKAFIDKLFIQNKDNQVALALAQEMQHQLSLFELEKQKMTPKEIKSKLDLAYSEEKISAFLAEKQAIFEAADTTEEILAVFNFKNMAKKVGEKFGIKGSDYPQRVLNILRSKRSERDAVLEAISKYTPELP